MAMTMLGPSFAVRAATMARAGRLGRSDRGRRRNGNYWTKTAGAAVVGFSGAGILLVCTSSSSTTPTSTTATKVIAAERGTGKSSKLHPAQHLYGWMTSLVAITRCEDNGAEEDEEDEPLLPFVENGEDANDLDTGYTEEERFYQCLDYHRSLLFDYYRRWGPVDVDDEQKQEDAETTSSSVELKRQQTTTLKHSAWPRHVPTADEINALETDLKFCLRDSCNHTDHLSSCHNLQFRIASYYVAQDDPNSQRKGFKKIKELAEQGHPDGMCYYGILLNEGKINGVDVNPQQAVVWFRRCVDDHRHIKATYELATANYLGEGTTENPELAVKLYRRAAHLGHAGAAYMLGECLLDGVGAERDRENALEWLVTAAELGHVLARKRVFTILAEKYENLDAGQANEQRKQEEAEKWINLRDEQKVKRVNIERKFSIGGGSRNPKIMARRRTKVQESRDETSL